MFEMMVAMNVQDEAVYAGYRAAMTPILHAHGGKFRYDFVVSAAPQSAADHPINRVFALHFPDRATRDAFFSNPDYQKVRAEYFSRAVAGRTLIAEYDLA